jgi:hypothetical protein
LPLDESSGAGHYLVHVAGYNLGIFARAVRSRHSKRGRKRHKRTLPVIQTNVAMAIVIVAEVDGELALLAIVAAPEPD